MSLAQTAAAQRQQRVAQQQRSMPRLFGHGSPPPGYQAAGQGSGRPPIMRQQGGRATPTREQGARAQSSSTTGTGLVPLFTAVATGTPRILDSITFSCGL